MSEPREIHPIQYFKDVTEARTAGNYTDFRGKPEPVEEADDQGEAPAATAPPKLVTLPNQPLPQ